MKVPLERRYGAIVGGLLIVSACTSGGDEPVASASVPTRQDPLVLATIAPVDAPVTPGSAGSAGSAAEIEPDAIEPTPNSARPEGTSPATAVSPAAWRRIVEGAIRQDHTANGPGGIEPDTDGSITVRYGRASESCQAVRLRADLLLVFSAAGNCDFAEPGSTDPAVSPWGTTGRLLSEFVGQVTGEVVVAEVSGDGTTGGDRTLGEAAGRLPGLTLLERDEASRRPAEASVARDAESVAVAVLAGTGRCLWFRADIADVLDSDAAAVEAAQTSLRYGVGGAAECRGDDAFAADSEEPAVPLS